MCLLGTRKVLPTRRALRITGGCPGVAEGDDERREEISITREVRKMNKPKVTRSDPKQQANQSEKQTDICFVIMSFGGYFDSYYDEI